MDSAVLMEDNHGSGQENHLVAHQLGNFMENVFSVGEIESGKTNSLPDPVAIESVLLDTVENSTENHCVAVSSPVEHSPPPIEGKYLTIDKKYCSVISLGQTESEKDSAVVDPVENSVDAGATCVGHKSGNNDMVVDTVEDSLALGANSLGDQSGKNNMDVDPVENLTTSVGDKREADNDIGNDLGSYKKAKIIKTSRDIKRVSEIVLVLSALGNMRGGRSPTSAEKEIMAEAREKLVRLCEGMAPKALIPRDALRVVIEDLGLNRPKDQRLSFRPPMMPIKEKLQLSKQKMEESQKFASQMLPGGFGAKDESRGAFVHTSQRFAQDTSGLSAVSTRGFTTPSSMFHVNEVQQPMVSRGTPSTPLERDASSVPLARTEPVHFRLEGRSNVPAYTSQVRANSSGDHLLGKTPIGAAQHQLGAVPRVGLANRMPDVKVEGVPVVGSSQVATLNARDRSSNVAEPAYKIPQAAQQPLQGSVSHNEIAKSVQRFLHPSIPEHPSWTPPSTDYMNKTLTCQACKGQVNDVESLLVCDACEKGNHIKCLESSNQRGIPKGEWHCPHCLSQSHGKPLPPKYGRVTRNNSLVKVASNAGGFQFSAERKVESSDQKGNHQKATVNGNLGSLHLAHVGADNIHTAAGSDLNMSNARDVQTARSPASRVKMDNGPHSEGTSPTKDMSMLVCALSSGRLNESPNKQFQLHGSFSCKPEVSVDPESKPNGEPAVSSLNKTSEAVIGTCHNLQIPCSSQDVSESLLPKLAQISPDQYNDVATPESRETFECKPRLDVRKDGQDAAQTVSVGNIGVGNGARDCLKSSLDGLHSVDWVGDILQVVDEKAFYNSCHINGMVYKLHDHALFHSNNDNLRPSKLQALWEDTKTGSKWAIVNSCYFPADLPEVVGRPCSPENNEVYESNHGSTVRAGLVQGPCEVLPPKKFKEETERRIHSDTEIQPVFLCKWFYDESKGLFRPVTD